MDRIPGRIQAIAPIGLVCQASDIHSILLIRRHRMHRRRSHSLTLSTIRYCQILPMSITMPS